MNSIELQSPYLPELKVYVNIENHENFRHEKVKRFLKEIEGKVELLDAGAGLMPYREICISLGHKYTSHDFEQYKAEKTHIGLIEDSYRQPKHDLVCDILELPSNKFSHILCTEVLEHVPDPILAFKSVMATLKSNGIAFFSVPMRSQIHQAPYYFCSGFSPYFFLQLVKENSYEIIEIVQIGDELDSLAHEIPQFFNQVHIKRIYLSIYLKKFLLKFFKFVRKYLDEEYLSSGGLGLIVIVKKCS